MTTPSPDENQGSARALADAEERMMAQKLLAVQAQQEPEPEQPPAEDLTELPMVTILARGRDTLEEAMRQQQKKMADAPVYVPPARTAAQQARLDEELAAGRKAQQKAQAQIEENRAIAARTNTPDPREGTTSPVHRSGLMVPDPKKGGLGVYSPTAM